MSEQALLVTSHSEILLNPKVFGSILLVGSYEAAQYSRLILPGLHFSLITPDDLILVSHDGRVIGGGRNRFLNYAAFAIHSEIHSARPDVVCAAHSHSTYGRAFCATGRTLDPITQDSCGFYNDHALYP